MKILKMSKHYFKQFYLNCFFLKFNLHLGCKNVNQVAYIYYKQRA